MRLILASTSPYRRRLLERLGLDFDVVAPEVCETPHDGELPETLVRRLASDKANAVAGRYPHAVVIGSDQLACLDGQILGKPGTVHKAQQQLRACSGRTIEFLTALTVCCRHSGEAFSALDRTEVRFRTLADEEIVDYVEREQPLDCAGAFKVEGLGIALFDSVHNDDPSALVGLPMIKLCALLARFGLSPLGTHRPPTPPSPR